MPKRARRQFTDEFKAEAVSLVRTSGKSLSQVARDLDLTQSALRLWVERSQRLADPASDLVPSERQELVQLRKENRVLRMERELLKNHPTRGPYLLNEKLLTWYRGRSQEGATVCFLGTTRSR
jgi:transposase